MKKISRNVTENWLSYIADNMNENIQGEVVQRNYILGHLYL